MSYSIMHEIHDPYAILKPRNNLLLDYETYRMVAYLVNPLIRADAIRSLDTFRWDSNTVLWTLKKNRILYKFLSLKGTSDSKKKDIFYRLKNDLVELQLSDTFYEIFENKVLELAEKLNIRGTDTIFLKAANTLPLDSHNLDLLVRERDKSSVESFLQEEGFAKVQFYKEPYKVLFRYTRNAEDYLAIHLHTKIAWHGVEFVDTRKIWEEHDVKKINGIDICFPNSTSHIPITIAHKFFEDAEINLGDVLTIANSIYENNIDVETLGTLADDAGWKDIFSACLSVVLTFYRDLYGNDFQSFSFNNGKTLNNSMLKQKSRFLPLKLDSGIKSIRRRRIIELGFFRKKLSNSRITFVKHIISMLLRRLLIGDKECHTFVIAMEGVDGAGKTLHSKKLLEEFDKREKKARHIWSSGSIPFTSTIQSFLSKVAPSISKREFTSSNTGSSLTFFNNLMRNKTLSSIFAIATIIDHNLTLLIKTLLAKRSYDIVIFDRFIHDTIVNNLFYYRKNLRSLFSRALLSGYPLLTPRPDITIVLYSTPVVLKARRQNELTFTEAAEKLGAYRYYGERWNGYLIESTEDFMKVHLKLLKTILERFYGKPR